GGGTTEVNGKLVPTFPNAKYYVQRANYETAKNPNAREKASYFAANFEPLIESGSLNFVEGETELLPGISVGVSNGHTVGHQFIKITDGEKTIVYCGDVIPTSSHVRLAWVMGYDLEPLKIIDEKRKLLTEAAQKGWYLFFEHDPYCDLASIEADGSDFKLKEKFRIS
ncbi:MAG: MBL fold metallo-hydrolase, partial [Bdellovibrionales bacterium]|nr:MBL fold metallo-hydrolase [Bdellovibrionales bacterium]